MFYEVRRRDFNNFDIDFYHLGKPETPTDLLISDLTATSFRARFSPSFDGGSGSQQFQIEMIDINNVSLAKHDLSSDTLEFTFTSEKSKYFANVYFHF